MLGSPRRTNALTGSSTFLLRVRFARGSSPTAGSPRIGSGAETMMANRDVHNVATRRLDGTRSWCSKMGGGSSGVLHGGAVLGPRIDARSLPARGLELIRHRVYVRLPWEVDSATGAGAMGSVVIEAREVTVRLDGEIDASRVAGLPLRPPRLAPVTARADEHLAPAPGTQKQPGIVHRRPLRGALDDPRSPGNTALGAVRKCGPGRSLGRDRQVHSVRGCAGLPGPCDLTPTPQRRHRTGARRRHSGSPTSVQVGSTSWAGSPGRFSACSIALRRSRQDLICTIYPHFSVATNNCCPGISTRGQAEIKVGGSHYLPLQSPSPTTRILGPTPPQRRP